jgi:hypothetical protein
MVGSFIKIDVLLIKNKFLGFSATTRIPFYTSQTTHLGSFNYGLSHLIYKVYSLLSTHKDSDAKSNLEIKFRLAKCWNYYFTFQLKPLFIEDYHPLNEKDQDS